MNWPNTITLFRLLLVPIYFVLLPSINNEYKHILSIFTITLGYGLDILDGYIARKYNLITNLGKNLDPLADKLLLVAVGIGLWHTGRLPLWLVLFIIVRETMMILGGVINYVYTKIAIPANALGKFNTCYVYVLIISFSFQWGISIYLAWGFVFLVITTTVTYFNTFLKKLSLKNLAK